MKQRIALAVLLVALSVGSLPKGDDRQGVLLLVIAGLAAWYTSGWWPR